MRRRKNNRATTSPPPSPPSSQTKPSTSPPRGKEFAPLFVQVAATFHLLLVFITWSSDRQSGAGAAMSPRRRLAPPIMLGLFFMSHFKKFRPYVLPVVFIVLPLGVSYRLSLPPSSALAVRGFARHRMIWAAGGTNSLPLLALRTRLSYFSATALSPLVDVSITLTHACISVIGVFARVLGWVNDWGSGAALWGNVAVQAAGIAMLVGYAAWQADGPEGSCRPMRLRWPKQLSGSRCFGDTWAPWTTRLAGPAIIELPHLRIGRPANVRRSSSGLTGAAGATMASATASVTSLAANKSRKGGRQPCFPVLLVPYLLVPVASQLLAIARSRLDSHVMSGSMTVAVALALAAMSSVLFLATMSSHLEVKVHDHSAAAIRRKKAHARRRVWGGQGHRDRFLEPKKKRSELRVAGLDGDDGCPPPSDAKPAHLPFKHSREVLSGSEFLERLAAGADFPPAAPPCAPPVKQPPLEEPLPEPDAGETASDTDGEEKEAQHGEKSSSRFASGEGAPLVSVPRSLLGARLSPHPAAAGAASAVEGAAVPPCEGGEGRGEAEEAAQAEEGVPVPRSSPGPREGLQNPSAEQVCHTLVLAIGPDAQADAQRWTAVQCVASLSQLAAAAMRTTEGALASLATATAGAGIVAVNRVVPTGSFPMRTYLSDSDVDCVVGISLRGLQFGEENAACAKQFSKLLLSEAAQCALDRRPEPASGANVNHVALVPGRRVVVRLRINNIEVDASVECDGSGRAAEGMVQFVRGFSADLARRRWGIHCLGGPWATDGQGCALFDHSVVLIKAFIRYEAHRWCGACGGRPSSEYPPHPGTTAAGSDHTLFPLPATGSSLAGAHSGGFSSIAITVMVMALFSDDETGAASAAGPQQQRLLDHPLDVLVQFAATYSQFRFADRAIACGGTDASLTRDGAARRRSKGTNGRSFSWRMLNVIDPLNPSNNLGAATTADSVWRLAAALGNLCHMFKQLPQHGQPGCGSARVNWSNVDGRVIASLVMGQAWHNLLVGGPKRQDHAHHPMAARQR